MYHQGPMKATGPAPVSSHRSRQEPNGAAAFQISILPQFPLLPGNPGHASPAVPPYPDRPDFHLNTPSLIAAGCPHVQPLGMTSPGDHRAGLSGDASVSRGWPPVGRGLRPDRSTYTFQQEVIKCALTGSSHTAAPTPPAPNGPERPHRLPASPKYERF